MAKVGCSELLEQSLARAKAHLGDSFIRDPSLRDKINYVISCPGNRAGARFLMATALAKLDKPRSDIRKPFIEVYSGAAKRNAYSGRRYDEQYVFEFIRKHRLPCSPTTAFLTPGFRTKNIVLAKGQKLRGRPPEMYEYILEILDAVQQGSISARAGWMSRFVFWFWSETGSRSGWRRY
jgi:DNA adenine methylase